MNRSWFFFFFVFSMLSIAAVSGQKCEPDCTGVAVGDYVPDPKNCSRYYICMTGGHPTDKPLSCNEGEEFHPIDGCVPAYGCKPTCTSSGGCHLTCITDEEFVADPFNCSVFYECNVNGPGPALSCPASFPHFNGNGCVDDASVCCQSGCSPYCDDFVIQVPDPSDCTRFYICDQGAPHGPFLCDPGENFDYGIGHCSASGPCRVWCSGGTANPIDPTVTTPIFPEDCLKEFVCEKRGVFQKCPDCYSYYFYCETVGQLASLEKCPDDLVFNPVPDHAYCVLPENCPFSPPSHEVLRQNSSDTKSKDRH